MAEIRVLPPAAKYIRKCRDKKLQSLFKDTLEKLQVNPYLGKLKTGDLAGIYSCDIYYNKTNYELAYTVHINENGEIVVVILAGTRENFYEQLKRYMKS